MHDKTFKDLRERMNSAIKVLNNDFTGIRTGRVSIHLLDPVKAEVYNTRMPLNQLGTISIVDNQTIAVQVWDKAHVKAVEKGIVEANIGVGTASEGQTVMVSIPPLSQERRKEFAKIASRYAENCRVALRNIRRDAIDELKKTSKTNSISEDDLRKRTNEVQKILDEYLLEVDKALSKKEKEVLSD